MRGDDRQATKLFSYISLEERVPKNHPLRDIRRMVDMALEDLGRRYCAAMVDVDHFKRFNDKHGHEVGDQVLKMVARCLSRVPGGRAYRYGGEEFAVLFPGRDRDDRGPQST